MVMLSFGVLTGECANALEGFIVPTPLERAKELVKSNKPQEALDALSSYLPSHEEFSAYHYAYAQALVQLNQRYESIEHYRLAYVYAGLEADKERMLLERAEVYADMGYFSEAAVCFRVFFKQFPKSSLAARAELGIAESLAALGEFREALVHFEKAGASLRVRYGKANALQSLGRIQEANDIYRNLIENDPEFIKSTPETLYNIGENYRQLGKLSDAKIYLTSVKDDILKYRAALSLGMIAIQEGQLESAVTYFNRAAESPERTVRREAVMKRAETHMRMGKYDEAQSALLEIRNSYPYGKQYDAASLLLAKLCRERGKFDEAVAILKTLIYRRTPLSAALDELESIMLEAKDRDPVAFVKLWNAAGRWLLDPSRSASLVKLAQGLRHSGKPYLEIAAWLIKYGQEPAKADGRLMLADFYADMGDAAMASGYLKRAGSRGRSDEALRIWAKVYMAGNDPVKASEAILSIQQIRESDILQLFDTMRALKNIEKPVAFSKKTLKKTQVTAPTLVRFADILYDRGRTGDALAYYERAVAAKIGTKKSTISADIEWAHYRISVLAPGQERIDSLKAIQEAKNAVGRLAAAELKSTSLRRKIE
jgi:tetratricopeptide (TPR) repeat protein